MPIEELVRPERIDEERIEKLKELFPEAFGDGKLNIDILKQEVEAINEEIIENNEEFYGLNWVGKKEARRLASATFKGTLIQNFNEGINENVTKNILVKGDNLETLRIMQKSYFSKIKMIYIDPPYNTGNDFVYPDDFKEPVDKYLQITGQADEKGILTSNPKASGRFHASWLNLMYPRLKLAKNLLQKDGLIFVSIDENEQANLKLLMDEIFGEENYVDTVIWKKRYGGGAKEKYLVRVHEYILIYARNKNELPPIFVPLSDEDIKRYYKSKDSNFELRGPYRTHPLEATKSVGERKNLIYPIPGPNGEEIWPERQWWWDKERVFTALENGELEFVKTNKGTYTVHTKQYLKDENGIIRKTKFQSIIDDIYTQHGTKEIETIFGDSTIFTFPKPTELIKRLINIADVKENEIVLDFFAGSGTTGHAVFLANNEDKINRQFILIQLPEKIEKQGYETIADITTDRLKRAINMMEKSNDDIDLGFRVFRLVKSNIRKWDSYQGDNLIQLNQNLDLFSNSPFAEEAVNEDVVCELMLHQGFPFNSVVTKEKIDLNCVFIVKHEDVPFSLIICLDERVTDDTCNHIIENYTSNVFICLDNALTNKHKLVLSESMNVKTI